MKEKSVLPYDDWIQQALCGVVKRALSYASKNELPSGHHFYITFQTGVAGVKVPKSMAEAHPNEMTIVLQHQFENLVIEEKFFSVTLFFDGVPTELVISFDSVISFADPSVNFGLQLQLAKVDSLDEPAEEQLIVKKHQKRESLKQKAKKKNEEKNNGEVVTLDNYRKKR